MSEPQIIKYGPLGHETVAIYEYLPPFSEETKIAPLIFFHGGAWRDPTNTFRDADALHRELNRVITLCSVEYRLSDQVKDGGFAQDVVGGVERIIQELGATKVSLLGHSVGATIALQCCISHGIAVDKLYLVEGIYDLKTLVQEYPEYEGFVSEAHDDYTSTVLDISKLDSSIEVHVIQSYEDELLSPTQTNWLTTQLQQNGIEYCLYMAHMGEHNRVYLKPDKLTSYINKTYI